MLTMIIIKEEMILEKISLLELVLYKEYLKPYLILDE